MSVKEKVAYLHGLAEGLSLDMKTKEGKLFSAIIDTLCVMADEIEELSENALDIGEELDALSDDLAEVEEFLFDDDDDDDYDYDFGDDDDDDYDEEDDDEGYACGCPYRSGANYTYTVDCPACGVAIELDDDDLTYDAVVCPGCGEELEFEFDEVDDSDEDDEDAEDEAVDNTEDAAADEKE